MSTASTLNMGVALKFEQNLKVLGIQDTEAARISVELVENSDELIDSSLRICTKYYDVDQTVRSGILVEVRRIISIEDLVPLWKSKIAEANTNESRRGEAPFSADEERIWLAEVVAEDKLVSTHWRVLGDEHGLTKRRPSNLGFDIVAVKTDPQTGKHIYRIEEVKFKEAGGNVGVTALEDTVTAGKQMEPLWIRTRPVAMRQQDLITEELRQELTAAIAEKRISLGMSVMQNANSDGKTITNALADFASENKFDDVTLFKPSPELGQIIKNP